MPAPNSPKLSAKAIANLPLARKAAIASRTCCASARPVSSSPTRARMPLTRGSAPAACSASRKSRRLGLPPRTSRRQPSSPRPSASPRFRSADRMMLLGSDGLPGCRRMTATATAMTNRTARTPIAAKKPTSRRRIAQMFAAERAVAQQMVGEHAGDHRLADRHRADADAGVVAAVGRDFDLVAVDIDRAHRGQDRAGRLDRKPRDDVLPGRDAAEDAAGVVRQKDDAAVGHAHLVGVLLAFAARRRRTRRRSRRP